MMYKTIVLELIQDCPELHDRLKASRTLPATLESYALELKARHEEWKNQLHQAKPGSDPSQVSSAAMERAIEELRADLLSESAATEADSPLSLDAAMNFIRTRTPVA